AASSWPAFLSSRPSRRSVPAVRSLLIASTTPLTGLLLVTISPTEAITASRPAVVFRSSRMTATRETASARMRRTTATRGTTAAGSISGVLEDLVEGAAVLGDHGNRLADLLLGRVEELDGVEVLGGGLRDGRHGFDGLGRRLGGIQHASQQDHHN